MIRHFLLGLSALSLLSCVDGAGLSRVGDGPTISLGAKVKIALLVPIESPNKNDSALGQDLINAAQLALTEYQDTSIALSVYPTAGQPERARLAAQQALMDGNQLIIGPLYAQSASPVAEVAAAKNINVLSFSNNTSIARDNLLVLGNSVDNTASRLLELASLEGLQSVAVVAPQNPAGDLATAAVERAANETGVAFIGAYRYAFSPQGIADAMPLIKQELLDAGVQSVVISADSGSGLPVIAEILSDGVVSQDKNGEDGAFNTDKPKGYYFMGLSRWDIPTSNLTIRGLRGGWFTLPNGNAISAFNSAYRETYDSSPHPLATLSYDAITAVAQLIRAGNKGALKRSQLSRRDGFIGGSGAFRILRDNTTQRALSVARVTNGAFEIISEATASFQR